MYSLSLHAFSVPVPGRPAFLKVTRSNLDSLTLEWGPPHERNGRLIGYTLKYQSGECPSNQSQFSIHNITVDQENLVCEAYVDLNILTNQEMVSVVRHLVVSVATSFYIIIFFEYGLVECHAYIQCICVLNLM